MGIFYSPTGYGAPMSGDQALFYEAGTTTPATVYEDAGLTDPIGTSVTADSNGSWPNIYLDPDTLYRVKIIRSDGDVGAPLRDIPQVNTEAGSGIADGSITAAMLAIGAAVSNIGYTPANKAGDTFTGDVKVDFNPTVLDPKSVGFRGSGAINTQDATYTFVLADSGRTTKHTSGSAHTWTIPLNSSVAYPVGTILPILNLGSGAVTIARTSGVELRTSGASTDENKTLNQYTAAALLKVDTNSWLMR